MNEQFDRAFDRRTFLHGAGVAALGLGASRFLNFSGSNPAVLAASGGTGGLPLGGPKPQVPGRGGQMRMAITGNGTSENYSPALANSPVDGLHLLLVYDSFKRTLPFYKTGPGLAVEWVHDKAATTWEIHLRKGVTFSDGKPFTADDVIYTMRLMANPSHLGHFAVVNVDLGGLKKLSDTIVKVPLKIPIADLAAYFTYPNSATIVKDGTKDFSHPIGTGPFILEHFTPGQRSVLKRNPNYWDDGKPYLDGFEVLSINDSTARLNALESGQVDIASGLDYVQARIGSTNKYNLIVGYGGINALLYMRVDQAPFNDNRVRQAMKLLTDRQGIINDAYDGLATPLYDVPGLGLPFYDSSIKTPHDVDQAKFLLKKAGQSDLHVTLDTANFGFQFPQVAAAFAQQAAAAGVKVKINTVPVASYENPTLLYLKMKFAQDVWPVTSLNEVYAQTLAKGAPANETHWNDASWNKLFLQAQAETNQNKAQELWSQVQQIQAKQGGNIYYGQIHSLDAIAKNVAGVGGPGYGWGGGLGNGRVYNWGFAK